MNKYKYIIELYNSKTGFLRSKIFYLVLLFNILYNHNTLYSQSFYPYLQLGFGSTSSDGIPVLASDPSENIYIAENFNAEPIIGTQHIPINSPKAMIITKLNSSGNIQWIQKIGSSTAINVKSIKWKDGFVYVGGTFNLRLFYVNEFGENDIMNSKGFYDIFIFKYTENGEYVSSFSIGDSKNNELSKMDLIEDDLILTGSFSGDFTLHNTKTTEDFTLTWMGFDEYCKDIFLIRIDQEGDCVWAKRGGGYDDDDVFNMYVFNNEIYLTGYFYSKTNFNTPSHSFSNTLSPVGYMDIFLAKYDQYGNPHWVRRAGSTYTGIEIDLLDLSIREYGSGLFVNQLGVFLTGCSFSNCNFNTPYDNNSNTILEKDGNFLAFYDFDGTFKWAKDLNILGVDSKIQISGNSNYLGIVCPYKGSLSLHSAELNDTIIFPNMINTNLFVGYYDFYGNFINGNSFGSTSTDEAGSILLTENQLHVASKFSDKLYVYEKLNQVELLTSYGNFDGYLLSYHLPNHPVDTVTPTIKAHLFPNPASEYIYISTYPELTSSKYTIFDVMGRALESGIVDNSYKQINLTNYTSGLYYVRIYSEKPKTFPFIKN
ncbi:MAG TPA: T9SS type A sorting domain-containing protein [Bacteroidales bacterium]|nr:T9SS type A sorting domain-containing protein [Bacteroidales bacterium]